MTFCYRSKGIAVVGPSTLYWQIGSHSRTRALDTLAGPALSQAALEKNVNICVHTCMKYIYIYMHTYIHTYMPT